MTYLCWAVNTNAERRLRRKTTYFPCEQQFSDVPTQKYAFILSRAENDVHRWYQLTQIVSQRLSSSPRPTMPESGISNTQYHDQKFQGEILMSSYVLKLLIVVFEALPFWKVGDR